jgi:hypothetical protein
MILIIYKLTFIEGLGSFVEIATIVETALEEGARESVTIWPGEGSISYYIFGENSLQDFTICPGQNAISLSITV